MVYPDYYPEFSCIAGACKNSCCIGWEIDVDEEALARFSKVEGELGQRLQENISMEDVPHFKLKEGIEGCTRWFFADSLPKGFTLD
jgi:lysine-N-methylase